MLSLGAGAWIAHLPGQDVPLIEPRMARPEQIERQRLWLRSAGVAQARPTGTASDSAQVTIHTPDLPAPALLSRSGASEDLTPAGVLPPWLAAAADRGADGPGLVLTATADGRLRAYDPLDLRPRGSHRLERPADQLALDARRGVLFAARGPVARNNGPADAALPAGDLVAYDVRDLLAGSLADDRELTPVWRLPLDGRVVQLLHDPAEDALYLLVTRGWDVSVARVSAGRRGVTRTIPARGGAAALALGDGGRTLFLAAPGVLRVMDAAGLEARANYQVPASATALAVDGDGRVYLADPARGTILVLQPEAGRLVGQWRLPLNGRLSLAVSAGRRRLYVGNSAVAGNRIWAVDLAGSPSRPAVLGEAAADDAGLIRGASLVTPGERFLLNSAGRVFRLADAAGPG